jgi:LuxR family maltose regulon positive regulatory protein
MLAESLLNRGEAEKAEIAGYKARQAAAANEQTAICIGVELFFGRLAIMRGDGSAFSHSLNSIADIVEKYPQKSHQMGKDLAQSYLAALLNRPQDAAVWLRHGPQDAFSRRLLAPAIPFAHICRARLLLLDRKPDVLLDESVAALGLAAGMKYTLAMIYGHIHMAAAWNMRGESGESAASLRKALDLALPDALYLPFAENYDFIRVLLTRTLSDKEQKKELSRIKALAKQMKEGRQSVLKEMQARELPIGERGLLQQSCETDLEKFYSFAAHYDLTEKEAEVLSHIFRKLSITEMAGSMGISDRGIKFHISNILDKANAKKRWDLFLLYAAWKMRPSEQPQGGNLE